MASTTTIEVTGEEWTQIGDGASTVLVQLKSYGNLLLRVENTLPGVVVKDGFTLSTNGMRQIAFNDLGTDEKVFVRSGGTAVKALVITTGA